MFNLLSNAYHVINKHTKNFIDNYHIFSISSICLIVLLTAIYGYDYQYSEDNSRVIILINCYALSYWFYCYFRLIKSNIMRFYYIRIFITLSCLILSILNINQPILSIANIKLFIVILSFNIGLLVNFLYERVEKNKTEQILKNSLEIIINNEVKNRIEEKENKTEDEHKKKL